VIIDQIAERERERSRKLESQDQERSALQRQHEQLKATELAQQVARKKAGEQMLRETSHSNAAQIGLKQQAAQAVRIYTTDIYMYICIYGCIYMYIYIYIYTQKGGRADAARDVTL